MGFGKPKAPKPPPTVAPNYITGDTGSIPGAAYSRARRRSKSLFGRQSTILTAGGAPATTPAKTLLGA
jgi:hypothetical protein